MIDRSNPKTVVLLCADLQTLGHGVDLAAVQKWLEETVRDVRVQLVPDLCHRSRDIAQALAAGSAARMVLGLCSGKVAVTGVQAQARQSGLDPLGIEAVDLGTYAALALPRSMATDKAKILLAAAVARARAFPGSGPENVKPYYPTKISRRALFSL